MRKISAAMSTATTFVFCLSRGLLTLWRMCHWSACVATVVKASWSLLCSAKPLMTCRMKAFVGQLMPPQKQQDQNFENIRHIPWRRDKYKLKGICWGIFTIHQHRGSKWQRRLTLHIHQPVESLDEKHNSTTPVKYLNCHVPQISLFFLDLPRSELSL